MCLCAFRQGVRGLSITTSVKRFIGGWESRTKIISIDMQAEAVLSTIPFINIAKGPQGSHLFTEFPYPCCLCLSQTHAHICDFRCYRLHISFVFHGGGDYLHARHFHKYWLCNLFSILTCSPYIQSPTISLKQSRVLFSMSWHIVFVSCETRHNKNQSILNMSEVFVQ